MDAAGDELADRIRALLSADVEIEERRMFGTRAFLDDGHILLGARPGGVLLVRVDDESGATLLTRPGVARGDGITHDELRLARRRARCDRRRRRADVLARRRAGVDRVSRGGAGDGLTSGAVHERFRPGTVDRVQRHGCPAERTCPFGSFRRAGRRSLLVRTDRGGAREPDQVRVHPGVDAPCLADARTEGWAVRVLCHVG